MSRPSLDTGIKKCHSCKARFDSTLHYCPECETLYEEAVERDKEYLSEEYEHNPTLPSRKPRKIKPKKIIL